MAARIGNITIDCDDPLAVSSFWSAALERPVQDGASEFFAAIPGESPTPNMFFIKVPEGKGGKNRVHLDLDADDRETEVKRLVELGASQVAEKDEWGTRWTVMEDVEGNEFCVAAHH